MAITSGCSEVPEHSRPLNRMSRRLLVALANQLMAENHMLGGQVDTLDAMYTKYRTNNKQLEQELAIIQKRVLRIERNRKADAIKIKRIKLLLEWNHDNPYYIDRQQTQPGERPEGDDGGTTG